MSPSWAKSGSKRWRYYVSQAALQGDKSKAGSIVRVPAHYLEALVAAAVGKQLPDCAASPADIRDRIDRVTVSYSAIHVRLSGSMETAEAGAGASALTIPWTLSSPYRKREIIPGVVNRKASARPMRANARAILINALGDSHRWLKELLSDSLRSLETIALREGRTERSIKMTLSLAFLAPGIVKAAVEGRLPRGYGLKRLVDLPMAWPAQWEALGLEPRPGRLTRTPFSARVVRAIRQHATLSVDRL